MKAQMAKSNGETPTQKDEMPSDITTV